MSKPFWIHLLILFYLIRIPLPQLKKLLMIVDMIEFNARHSALKFEKSVIIIVRLLIITTWQVALASNFFPNGTAIKEWGKTVDFSSIFSNFWALCKAHHPKCLDGETLCKCKLDFICLDNNGKVNGVSTSSLTGNQSGQTFGSITVSLVSSILTTAITNIYFYRLTMMMWILVRLAMITLTMKNLTNPQ